MVLDEIFSALDEIFTVFVYLLALAFWCVLALLAFE